MKKSKRKKIVTILIAMLLVITTTTVVLAAEQIGSVSYFTEDGNNYCTYSVIYVDDPLYAIARQRVVSNISRPAGYLYAQACLYNGNGQLVSSRTGTNNYATTDLEVSSAITETNGTYYAIGGGQVWRNGSYSSFYFSGQTPLLTLH